MTKSSSIRHELPYIAMKVALIASNMLRIDENIKKGIEIFYYSLVRSLHARITETEQNIELLAFCSGDSDMPVEIISINPLSSANDETIGINNFYIFELAMLAKAFEMQNEIDIYHCHIGNNEVIFPFAQFVHKPLILTMHANLDKPYMKKYYDLFKNRKNIHIVSISNSQRTPLPELPYVKTIYHGVDTRHTFLFDAHGGDRIIWAGRAIPEKGLDTVFEVVRDTARPAKVFPILKPEHFDWFNHTLTLRDAAQKSTSIKMNFNLSRKDLSAQYQTSKLFLFPMHWEEPFGLVMIESMACGTPVVAYARGSAPEVIVDGVTGFLVNPSDDDIRGNFIIQKTGKAGLCEAIERIYALSAHDYRAMRRATREHTEKYFTVERMVDEYIDLYKQLSTK